MGARKEKRKKYECDIIQAEHDHPLMLGGIFCYSTKVCLEDVVAIQEGHFAVGLDPDLVFRILGDLVESSNVELEFAAFAEFSEAGTKGDEVCSCDRDAQTHRGFRHIVDLVLVQPEAIGLVLAVDEVDKILANVICEFRKDGFALVLGERTHRGEEERWPSSTATLPLS
jgi:hypothetical protein